MQQEGSGSDMTIQRRIGVIFLILSFITVVANMIYIYNEYSLLNIIVCLFLVISFGYSAIFESQFAKILQVFSFLLSSGLSFMFNENLMFGSAILILEVFVLYAYDFYQNNVVIKVIGTISSIGLFIFSSVKPMESAVMWFVFTNIIIVAIFMILYEKLKRAYNAITKSEDITARAMDLVERINHDSKVER